MKPIIQFCLLIIISCNSKSTSNESSDNDLVDVNSLSTQEFSLLKILKNAIGYSTTTDDPELKILEYSYLNKTVIIKFGKNNVFSKREYSNIKWSFLVPTFGELKFGELVQISIRVPCHLKTTHNTIQHPNTVNTYERENEGISFYLLPGDVEEFKHTILDLRDNPQY